MRDERNTTTAAPDDEAQRLCAIVACGSAGTAPEADFDHVAAMAAGLLGPPVGGKSPPPSRPGQRAALQPAAG